jgi:tRNA (guanine37-N1)-methyltransferase
MVMKAEPLAAALRAVTKNQEPGTKNHVTGEQVLGSSQVILMTPAGERFDQRVARDLATYDRLVLVCGHYEGVDQRVVDALVDRELSIGDYVLTGGELAAMVVVDAVARLVSGVIDAESTG